MRCVTLLSKPKVALRVTKITMARTIRQNKLGAAAVAACVQSFGDAVSDKDAVASCMLHGLSTYLTVLVGLL